MSIPALLQETSFTTAATTAATMPNPAVSPAISAAKGTLRSHIKSRLSKIPADLVAEQSGHIRRERERSSTRLTAPQHEHASRHSSLCPSTPLPPG